MCSSRSEALGSIHSEAALVAPSFFGPQSAPLVNVAGVTRWLMAHTRWADDRISCVHRGARCLWSTCVHVFGGRSILCGPCYAVHTMRGDTPDGGAARVHLAMGSCRVGVARFEGVHCGGAHAQAGWCTDGVRMVWWYGWFLHDGCAQRRWIRVWEIERGCGRTGSGRATYSAWMGRATRLRAT